MKSKFITTILILLVLVSFAFAQQPDSTKKTAKKAVPADSLSKTAKKKVSSRDKMKEKMDNFVDKNANGIDDRMEMGGKRSVKKGKADIFIDKDGDGICDGRESAIGLKKIMRHRHRGKPPM